jgi:hypothetical protein
VSTIYPGQPSSAGHRHDERTGSRLARFVGDHPLVPAIVIILVAASVRAHGTVDSDVAWQLWTARHLNQGAVLYRDIVEVNPPLWFWMGMPVDRAASILGARIEAVLMVVLAALVLLSLQATNLLLRGHSPLRRAPVLAYAAATLFIMPWLHAGQREQLLLIAALPYCALIAARRDRASVRPWLAAAVGAGAALAFALKHYFLIVPVLLELWLLASRKREWRPLRPETIVILAVGVLYAAAVLIWAGDFLAMIVPMARLAYGVTGAVSLMQLVSSGMLVGLVALAVAAIHYRHLRQPDAGFGAALFIAAIGFAAIYFMQAKGWIYHAIPVEGGAALALAALVLLPATAPTALRLLAPALLSLPFVVTAQEVAREPGAPPDIIEAVSGLRPGASVGFITEDTAPPFSVTLQHGFRYATRYNGFWMLRAIATNEASRRPDPRIGEIGRMAISQVVTDLRCAGPQRIVIARPFPGAWNEHSIDILPYFQRDPAFTELLSHYRRVGPPSTYDVYDRVTASAPMPASSCRQGF